MKKIFISLAVAAVIAICVFVFILNNLDGLIKETIEQVGTKVLGVDVTVESVTIKLKDGSGEIKGLRIANPKDYKSAYAFEMSVVRLGIDLKSLGKSPVILNEITIDSPISTLEITSPQTNNLKQILDNISKGSSKDQEQKTTKEEKPKEETVAKEPSTPTLISIKKLFIKGVTFNILDQRNKTEGKIKTGTIPTIDLNDLGGNTGITPELIASKIIKKLVSEILKEGLQGELKGKIFSGLLNKK